MWPLGHVAIAYLLYVGSTRLRSLGRVTAGPALAVCLGGLFPDLVDKPLSWGLGVLPTGRSLAHSLLVLVPLCLLVYAASNRRGDGEDGLAFAVGALVHPLVDALPALWSSSDLAFLLWPYLPVEPYETGTPNPLEMLWGALTQAYFLAEFVLFVAALLVWRADRYPGLATLRHLLVDRQVQTG